MRSNDGIGPVQPGASFDAYAEGFDTGLAAQMTVAIYDQTGAVILAPTNVGIVEVAPIGTLARYYWPGTAPALSDTYLIVWDDNQADPNSASEELTVTWNTGGGPGGTSGWITGDDVAECCSGAYAGSDFSVFDNAADAAVDVLFVLSGRQFAGLQGPVTVRPFGHEWLGDLSWVMPGAGDGPVWTGYGGWSFPVGRHRLGCNGLSKVTLSGFPVREITEVKIDGVVLAASEYRLDYARDLVRLRDPANPRRRLHWPCCQILDLADSEPGTWSVSYTYGADPPWQAIEAAKELACEIYKACSDDGDCQLPSGVTKVTRQGVQIERSMLATALAAGAVGLPMTDLFLGTYNPDKLPRRSAVWSPDVHPYPYRPGT